MGVKGRGPHGPWIQWIRKYRLCVQVIHKAVLEVNEEGSEAAAATAVMLGRGSAPPRVVTVTVDRPFLCVIRDNRSGAALFVGRVARPAA